MCGLGGEIPSPECANLVMWCESVAQLVEHRPFKALVLGSNPSALTIPFQDQHFFNSGPAAAAASSPRVTRKIPTPKEPPGIPADGLFCKGLLYTIFQ